MRSLPAASSGSGAKQPFQSMLPAAMRAQLHARRRRPGRQPGEVLHARAGWRRCAAASRRRGRQRSCRPAARGRRRAADPSRGSARAGRRRRFAPPRWMTTTTLQAASGREVPAPFPVALQRHGGLRQRDPAELDLTAEHIDARRPAPALAKAISSRAPRPVPLTSRRHRGWRYRATRVFGAALSALHSNRPG